MYKIEWTKKALDNLEDFENSISQRIIKKVNELSANPFSKDIKKLKNMLGYRLRVGDYRIIFDIEKDVVVILKIGHRKNIYE
ncbi:type II toxin-antitoxin system RelE/ParE family toxin [Candidatus Pacearchaeota archaeon]|nr:type II toxin-antitoxin system RelE/ParE family toxin [Candidatus Pacearchaeota archaeon]